MRHNFLKISINFRNEGSFSGYFKPEEDFERHKKKVIPLEKYGSNIKINLRTSDCSGHDITPATDFKRWATPIHARDAHLEH